MTGRYLIYGVTGYTGRLTARAARDRGLKPVLAGRNPARVKAIAESYGMPHRGFELDDAAAIDRALADIDLVVHMAGPFSKTWRLMYEACKRTHTHYADITGEIDVFETLALKFPESQDAGIMTLPGVGFDVVPSDCLAAHLKRRLPSATKLTLAIQGLTGMSRGTAKTAIESIGKGTRVRQDNKVIALPKAPRAQFDFGDGPVDCIAVGWGDVSTAFHSTAIPNITVYFAATPELEQVANLSSVARFFLSMPLFQNRLKRDIDKRPEGPGAEERAKGKCILVGVAEDEAGNRVSSRLITPEGYSLTAQTALEIAERCVNGAAKPGFQTPSRLFGPDFILEFKGVERTDLD